MEMKKSLLKLNCVAALALCAGVPIANSVSSVYAETTAQSQTDANSFSAKLSSKAEQSGRLLVRNSAKELSITKVELLDKDSKSLKTIYDSAKESKDVTKSGEDLLVNFDAPKAEGMSVKVSYDRSKLDDKEAIATVAVLLKDGAGTSAAKQFNAKNESKDQINKSTDAALAKLQELKKAEDAKNTETRPSSETKPSAETKPSEATKPSTSASETKPSTSSSEATKPADVTKPAETTKPSAEVKPSTDAKPADVTKPSVSKETKPSAEVKPSTETEPSAETKPSTSASTSTKPSTETKTSSETKPSVSKETKPSADTKSSSETKPSISKETKPSAETKSSDTTKPSSNETKPSAETKPSTETKTSSETKPSTETKPSAETKPSTQNDNANSKVNNPFAEIVKEKASFDNIQLDRAKSIADQFVQSYEKAVNAAKPETLPKTEKDLADKSILDLKKEAANEKATSASIGQAYNTAYDAVKALSDKIDQKSKETKPSTSQSSETKDKGKTPSKYADTNEKSSVSKIVIGSVMLAITAAAGFFGYKKFKESNENESSEN